MNRQQEQPTGTTVWDFCNNAWIPTMQNARTRRNVRSAILRLVEWYSEQNDGRDLLLADLSAEIVTLFAKTLSDRPSDSTVNGYVFAIRKLWAVAASSGLASPPKRRISAQQRETTRLRELAESIIIGDGDSLLAAHTQLFVPVRLALCRPNTHRLYEYSLRSLTRYLERAPLLTDLRDDTIAAWMMWCVDEAGLANRTANNQRAYMLSLWRFLARKRVVDEFPEVGELPVSEPIPFAWSEAQLNKLFQSCARHRGHIATIPAGLWWQSLHYALWNTGERIGALLAAKWEWVDLESRTLALPGSARKGGRKSFVHRLKPVTINMLKQIRQGSHMPGNELVFPFPWSISTFYNHYTKILKRADLPSGREYKAHCMRKSFATHLENAGGNATEALRHSNRSLTEKSYLDPRKIDKPSPNELLFRIDPQSNDEKGGAE